MTSKTLGKVAAAVAAIGALGLGGAALANASATGASAAHGYGYAGSGTTGAPGARDGGGRGGAGGGSQDTPVTGDEAAKVSAAVTAKDSGVTVESVRKDPDGSYDVLGTKDGQKVMFDVSADLATVSQAQGGGRGGAGGGSQDTPVTGDEAAKVSAAVTAKDSGVTVESVRKDPDGSYDVLGTKDGQKVMFDVSADLATVSQAQGGQGGKQGHGPRGGGSGGAAPTAPSGSSTAPSGS